MLWTAFPQFGLGLAHQHTEIGYDTKNSPDASFENDIDYHIKSYSKVSLLDIRSMAKLHRNFNKAPVRHSIAQLPTLS